MPDHITTTEAAKRLGITRRRVQALCTQGRIEGAERLGRDWLIPLPIRITECGRGPRAGWAKRGR